MDIIMEGPKARRGNPAVAIAVVAVAASALFSGYTWYQAHHHPVAVYIDKWATVRSRVISATVTAFQSQNNLTVKSMSGNVQVQAERGAWFLNGKQKISMPASVLYFIDLKAVKNEDINYDPYAKVLFIKLPQVQISPVTFKMEEARQQNGGLLTISNGVREQLSKINYANASASFTQLAKDQARLDAARAEAQKNISALLEIPLKATGNGDISVRAY